MSDEEEQEGLTPPPGVGPHEARELELMLRGEKPLAYFSEATSVDFPWPDARFAPHVASGRIIQRDYLVTEEVEGRVLETRYLYFALPGEEWRIDAAHANRTRATRSDADHIDQCREMGALLGYTASEIEAFVAWSAHVRDLIRSGEWTPERSDPPSAEAGD